MEVLPTADMRDLDRLAITRGIPGITLMEQAGRGLTEHFTEWLGQLGRHAQRVLILCGKGHNAGDGLVMARLLVGHPGVSAVAVLATTPWAELAGDARTNAERLPPAVGVLPGALIPADWLRPGTVLVDALLGTGFSGAVREPLASLINQVNGSGLPVFAVDLPSGVDADNGAVAGAAITADLTVTLAAPKPGLFLGEGLVRRGRLRCVPLDFPPDLLARRHGPFTAFLAADARRLLGRLPATAHKVTQGRVQVIGGCRRYPGAPVLAAMGALRLGGGLVGLAYPAAMAPLLRIPALALLQNAIPDDGTGHHQMAGLPALLALVATQDALVLGPGLGREPGTLAMVASVLREARCPVVLDADALQVFASEPQVLPRPGATVLTPHGGELRRVLEAVGLGGLVGMDRAVQARLLAQHLGAIVVAKGPGTVVAAPDGRLSYNSSGTAGLATGGSGDVLAGLIAAALVQVPEPFAATCLAVFLHGWAAEQAPYGMRHLIADELPDLLGPALAELSPFA